MKTEEIIFYQNKVTIILRMEIYQALVCLYGLTQV